MPMLIRSPEDIFRAEGKDIYVLHFLQDDPDEADRTRSEMTDWFGQHLPTSRTEWMAPSEHSGYIVGGPVGLRVDFTDADLAAFCAQWETPAGKSLDPRFQCYLMPYERWHAKYGHFVPSLDKPTHRGPALWIDTPLGVLTHVVADDPESEVTRHPGHYLDLWMHAVKLWPKLATLDADDLVHGWVYRTKDEAAVWMVVYSDSFRAPLQPERQAEILAWLGFPADAQMVSEY